MINEDWHVKNIYLYTVCLIMLFLIVLGTIQLTNNTLSYFFDSDPYYPTLMEIENRYRGSEEEIPSLEKLKEMQASEIQEINLQDANSSYPLRRILDSLALILIPLPIYLFHWRRAKASQRSNK